jgi:hypothetical protein
MSKAAAYRRFAQECLQIATTASPEQRLLLIEMASLHRSRGTSTGQAHPGLSAAMGSAGPLPNNHELWWPHL